MTSEIRANTIKNRVGLGTVSYTNTGIIVSGIVTANSFSGPISGTTGTFSGDVDINGDLDVDGHTNLDNVSVAGVSTFTGAVTAHDYRSGGGVGNTLYLTSADDWRFRATGGAERLRITSDGKILISQTTSNWGTTSANSVIQLKNGVVWDYAGVQLDVGHNYYYNSSGAYKYIRGGYAARQTFHNNDGSIAFWSGGTGSADGTFTWSERLRITSGGQVRVSDGTTAVPSVAAASDTNSGLYFPSADAVGLVAGGSRKLLVNSSGVTINNGDLAVNGGNLDVTGDIRHIDNTNTKIAFTSNQIDLQCAGSSRAYINNYGLYIASGFPLAFLASSGATPNIKSGGTNAQDLLFTTGTGNPTRLSITSAGKVGIGTDNPDELLHIFSLSGSSKIVLEADNNSANNGIYWVDEGNNTSSEFYYDHGGNKQNLKVNGNGLEIYSKQTNSVIAKIGHASGYNDLIIPNGKIGVNDDSPTTQLSVITDGLDDNSYAFKTSYRSGNNASGYTASGITIVSSADNNNGENHTAYLQFSNRDPALNGSHGASAFITMTTNGVGSGYGNGQIDFYCRNAAAYGFPNDPQVSSGYWMNSLFRIKSTGELFGYGNLRIDINSGSDGIIGQAYGTYFGLKHADQTYGSEYMMISNNSHTYISCTSGYSIYVRPSANSSAHETIFSHDNTTFKSNVLMDNHALRRNQHQWGHMEGGHNNIGSTNNKTSPIYTIGSSYNPNENDLNNMYGIGFCASSASFIPSNIPSAWGLYVASDGDARMFLSGGDGIVYAKGYGRYEHDSGHLIGSYNNVGANSGNTNPIYTIGSSYNPQSSSLSNMYGIGYSHGNNASFISFSGLTGWGLYVAADGDCRMFLDATTGKIAATGTITGSASDVRLKTNIKVIDNPIEKIKKIRGVTFDWVDNITSEYDFHPDSMHETGVIAQEIQEVIPDAVATAPFNGNYTKKSGTDNNYLTVKNEKIIPLCIEAIKELSAKVEVLEQENTTLKARVNTLEG